MAKRPGLEQIDDYRWRVPQDGPMRVPGIVYASGKMLPQIENEGAIDQVRNGLDERYGKGSLD